MSDELTADAASKPGADSNSFESPWPVSELSEKLANYIKRLGTVWIEVFQSPVFYVALATLIFVRRMGPRSSVQSVQMRRGIWTIPALSMRSWAIGGSLA